MRSQIDSTKPAPRIDRGWIHTSYSSLISRANRVTRIHYSVRCCIGSLSFKQLQGEPTLRAEYRNILDDAHNNDDDDYDDNDGDDMHWD
jgi:hypothetical protein